MSGSKISCRLFRLLVFYSFPEKACLTDKDICLLSLGLFTYLLGTFLLLSATVRPFGKSQMSLSERQDRGGEQEKFLCALGEWASKKKTSDYPLRGKGHSLSSKVSSWLSLASRLEICTWLPGGIPTQMILGIPNL